MKSCSFCPFSYSLTPNMYFSCIRSVLPWLMLPIRFRAFMAFGIPCLVMRNFGVSYR